MALCGSGVICAGTHYSLIRDVEGWGSDAVTDAMYIVMKDHLGWVLITCGVSREGIWCFVLDSRDVDYFEVVSQSSPSSSCV